MKRRLIVVSTLLLSVGALWAQTAGLPAGEADTRARLNTSPRHGEWVTYNSEGGAWKLGSCFPSEMTQRRWSWSSTRTVA